MTLSNTERRNARCRISADLRRYSLIPFDL